MFNNYFYVDYHIDKVTIAELDKRKQMCRKKFFTGNALLISSLMLTYWFYQSK